MARDFANLSDRFRRGADAPSGRGGAFLYTPDTVRASQPIPRFRIQRWAQHSLPKTATVVTGVVLVLVGVLNAAEILSLRGSQHSMVDNLLLVFLGAFLVFFALHDGHVERAHKERP